MAPRVQAGANATAITAGSEVSTARLTHATADAASHTVSVVR
ncbi:hypothetical protein [Streptomyces lannensis]